MNKEQIQSIKDILKVVEMATFNNLSAIKIIQINKYMTDFSVTVKNLENELNGSIAKDSKNGISE
jgi:hypothetical protein